LVLVGERDLADFRAIADLLARDIPRARKIVLPGVGHMSNMEGPEPQLAQKVAYQED
jgi:3-oxoadipate enol-lactonase